mgnify:CR=1 FL=1
MKRTLFIGMLGLSALMSGYAQQGEGVRKGRIVREPLYMTLSWQKKGIHIIFIPPVSYTHLTLPTNSRV